MSFDPLSLSDEFTEGLYPSIVLDGVVMLFRMEQESFRHKRKLAKSLLELNASLYPVNEIRGYS